MYSIKVSYSYPKNPKSVVDQIFGAKATDIYYVAVSDIETALLKVKKHLKGHSKIKFLEIKEVEGTLLT